MTDWALAAVIGFIAGLADFSVGAGFDALAVPSLILLGKEPQTAIADGLLAQLVSSTLFGALKRKAILTRKGAVVIASATATALALSTASLSVSDAVVRAAVGSVLILLATAITVKALVSGLGQGAPDDISEARLAALAAGAGAVKGFAGSGMSAVMMLGQLVLGASVSGAVVMAVAAKSFPAAAALAPRLVSGGLDPATALGLTAGAVASVALAERVRSSVRQSVLSAALIAYAALTGAYLVITSLK